MKLTNHVRGLMLFKGAGRNSCVCLCWNLWNDYVLKLWVSMCVYMLEIMCALAGNSCVFWLKIIERLCAEIDDFSLCFCWKFVCCAGNSCVFIFWKFVCVLAENC